MTLSRQEQKVAESILTTLTVEKNVNTFNYEILKDGKKVVAYGTKSVALYEAVRKEGKNIFDYV